MGLKRRRRRRREKMRLISIELQLITAQESSGEKRKECVNPRRRTGRVHSARHAADHLWAQDGHISSPLRKAFFLLLPLPCVFFAKCLLFFFLQIFNQQNYLQLAKRQTAIKNRDTHKKRDGWDKLFLLLFYEERPEPLGRDPLLDD